MGGVVNAASAQAPLDANNQPIAANTIAQGAIFTIFGSGLGPAALAAPSGLPLPTQFPDASGTSVTVSSGSQTIAAFILYISAAQVAAILPSAIKVGPATVSVRFGGKTSAGDGPAIVQVARSQTDITVNSLTNCAAAGDTLIVYGTGLGPITGADNTAPGVVAAGRNVTVNVAGIAIRPTYGETTEVAGLAGGGDLRGDIAPGRDVGRELEIDLVEPGEVRRAAGVETSTHNRW